MPKSEGSVMLVDDFLARAAVRSPDAVAAIDEKRSIRYGQLERAANGVAALMRRQGVKPGDRVVVAMENSIPFIACYFGVLKAGGVVVPLPPVKSADRLPYAIGDCAPAACLVGPLSGAVASMLSRSVPVVMAAGYQENDRFCSDAQVPTFDLDEVAACANDSALRRIDIDLAAIIYTSGSTGAPRGVMLTHLNLRSNTESIIQYLGLTSSDRVMVVLPFHYIYGLSLLNTHIAAGGGVVIDNRITFPNAVLETVRRQEVTGFAGVPSTFALLLDRSSIRKMGFPSLRYVTQAGGAMPPSRIREWREALPEVPFYVMYGATEAAGRLSYLDPRELERRLGSIGCAIPNVRLTVVSEDGRTAAPREVGEIVASGSTVSPGYWNCPDETREMFGPGGYRTGDLGYADEDGFLYLTGRRHDLLKVGGYRVSVKEIEDVLNEHVAVHEVAVVGVADDLLGDRLVAFISLRNGDAADEQTLRAFCRRHLPEYKVPLRIVITGDLPKGPAGKLLKSALREKALHMAQEVTPAKTVAPGQEPAG
jgi:long-chain acyl-CoA synthetase